MGFSIRSEGLEGKGSTITWDAMVGAVGGDSDEQQGPDGRQDHVLRFVSGSKLLSCGEGNKVCWNGWHDQRMGRRNPFVGYTHPASWVLVMFLFFTVLCSGEQSIVCLVKIHANRDSEMVDVIGQKLDGG